MSSLPSPLIELPPLLLNKDDAARFTRSLIREFERLAEGRSEMVIAPLPSINIGDASYKLPRFAYLGANPEVTPIRLAIYGGWHGDDYRPTYALYRLLRQLLLHPGLGFGYQLIVYPFINPTGFLNHTRENALGQDIKDDSWLFPQSPELQALGREFRSHGFDGWLSIQTVNDLDKIQARTIGLPANADYFPVEQGRYSIDWRNAEANHGPVEFTKDLPAKPFGLELDLPAHWPDDIISGRVLATSLGFLDRYRAARTLAHYI